MLEFVVRVVGVLVAFLVAPLLVGQAEHKVMAHMQSRLGPMYAGAFHGWAQLVADGVKFVQKESVVPTAADRRVFELAPIVALLPYLAALAAIPLAPGIVGADLDSGPVLRARGDEHRRTRLADGRLGERQQVQPARRAPGRGAADELRASVRALRGERRGGGRIAQPDRHRPRVEPVVVALAVARA